MLNEVVRKRVLSLLLLTAICSFAVTSAQESAPPTPDYLAIVTNFLRAFYPELSNKNYFLTYETDLYYDKPSSPFGGLLHVSVGNVPRGYDVPDPGSKCPPGAVQTQRVASGGFVEGNCPPPIGNRQFLSAGFHFDEQGHLAWFNAEGPATTNLDAKAALVKANGAGEGPQTVTAMKRLGAKYGPDDREEFLKNLPVAKLDNFLGKLNIVSVNFAPYLEADRSNFTDKMLWEVRAEVKRSDGTSASYFLEFEQYEGNLVTLCDTSTYPCKAQSHSPEQR